MNIRLDSTKLNQSCQPAVFTDKLENLHTAHRLVDLMLKEHGIGLAANQAGIDLRLFVMYVDREIFHCFNPEIVSVGFELVTADEGCLSFPGERCLVTRHQAIQTKFYNARGDLHEREFTGLAARCFQHELDHLNGITMHERAQVIHD